MSRKPGPIAIASLLFLESIAFPGLAESGVSESLLQLSPSPVVRQYRSSTTEANFLSDTSWWSWGELKGEFGVSIRMEKDEFTFLEPIYLLIACRNLSNEDRLFSVSRPKYMFQITVKDSTGSAVPLTRYGELTRVPRSFASYAVRIEPNHGLGYVVDLRHTFDLTLAGRYSVQVSTKSASLDRLTIEDVVSNTTEFEVKGKRLPPIQKFIAVEEPEKPAAPSANPHSNLDDIPEGFEEIRIE